MKVKFITGNAAQASHYDADSGIYIGPRKLSEDESILACLSVQEPEPENGPSKEERTSPLTVDPLSGIQTFTQKCHQITFSLT